MKKGLLVCSMLFIFCVNSHAQKTLKDSVSSTTTLRPVVLSASFQKESGVLVPTSQISEDAIAQFSPVDLVDAINQTPGVYIQSGAINTNRITIRGVGSRTLFGTNKIRAYFNGIPITNGAGETTIDSYNTSTIGNLEIVKGPKATQYGSNLGGTLLLSTNKPEADGFSLHNYFTVGSFGLFKHTTNFVVEDDDLSVHYSYDHLQLDGYRENNAYNRNGYLLTIDSKVNDTFSLGILFQHFNTYAEIASSLSRENFDVAPSQAAFTWGQAKGFKDNRSVLTGLSLTSKISESVSNTTSVYYSYLDSYEPRPFNILDQHTNGYGARSIFAKEFFNRNGKTIISLGTEWNQDFYNWETIENRYEENAGLGSLEGQILSDNKEERTSFNVFGTAKFPISAKIKAEVGLNVNKTQYSYSDLFTLGTENKSANRNFDPILAPNLSLLYLLNSSITFYANVSRGFNYPSIEETLTPEGVINPDISPEKGWNYEIGTETNFFNNKLQIQVAAYLLSIQDLLVAERVGDDQFIGRNAGKTEHKGLEVSINYKDRLGEKLTLAAYVNSEFNAHTFVDFVDGDSDFSGNDLTGIPREKIAAGFRVTHDLGFFASTNYQYIGVQPITDSNSLYSDSYQIVNILAGYKTTVYNFLTATISAGINNLADETYASSILINASSFGGNSPRHFYPGEPRNYFTSVQVSYFF